MAFSFPGLSQYVGPLLPSVPDPSKAGQQIPGPSKAGQLIPDPSKAGQGLSLMSLGAAGTAGALDAFGQSVAGGRDAFAQSLAASRGDVERLFGTVLGEIGKQNEIAGQQIGQIPGQVNSIYDQAGDVFNQGLAALGGAQQAAGLQSFMPAEAAAFPIQQALGQSRATRLAQVPMLQAGLQELASRQRAQAELSRAGMLGDLASEERSYRQQESRDPLAEYEGKLLLDRQYGVGDFAPQGEADDPLFDLRTQLAGWGKQAGYQKGQLLASLPEAGQIRSSAPYRSLESQFRAKFGTDLPDAEEARRFLLEAAAGRPWDRSVSLLMADQGIDDLDLPATGLLPAGTAKKQAGRGLLNTFSLGLLDDPDAAAAGAKKQDRSLRSLLSLGLL